VAFTVYIIVLMNIADHLPCSCGGVLAELSWGEHIVFNCVYIVLGILGIILERRIRINTSTTHPLRDQQPTLNM
jgi:hypothetical protein